MKLPKETKRENMKQAIGDGNDEFFKGSFIDNLLERWILFKIMDADPNLIGPFAKRLYPRPFSLGMTDNPRLKVKNQLPLPLIVYPNPRLTFSE